MEQILIINTIMMVMNCIMLGINSHYIKNGVGNDDY